MATTAVSSDQLQVVTDFGGNGTGMDDPASNFMGQKASKLKIFQKGQPKALGTLQIIIGLTGIVMAVNADSFGVFTGITFGGSMIYIATGSLAIAADKKLNKCMVNATLAMSVVACIAAGVGIIFYSCDIAGLLIQYYCYPSSQGHSSHDYECAYKIRSSGIPGVMLVLSVLEFIICICMSPFACKAACNSG